jgi:glycosyltransferase involved in cell wall biosynthesis
VPWDGVRRAARLAGASLTFTGCSASLYASGAVNGSAARWRTVFNGVDMTRYAATANVAPDAPLVFLGRLERIKGPHHAIAIARRAQRRLVLAGNLVTAGSDAAFYEQEIAPHLDGTQVRYIGPVDDEQKNELLGQAAALLMPIEWDEPFGIVMAEALACGTPVIGFARGSVPEVVVDGRNGYHCQSIEDAAARVADLDRLDRLAVRADAERRFGHEAIVSAYERLYHEVAA